MLPAFYELLTAFAISGIAGAIGYLFVLLSGF